MAQFKTGHDQYVVPLNVVVVGAVKTGTDVNKSNRRHAICPGDFVTYHAETDSISAYIQKTIDTDVASHKATHIVAMSDIAMGNSNVNTAGRDYRTPVLVGATTSSDAIPSGKTDEKKVVGLYPIFDWNDIIPDKDKNDTDSD